MNTSPTPLALFAKRLLEVGLVCGVAIFLAHGIVDLPTARSQGEERRFKCKEFPNMPLRQGQASVRFSVPPKRTIIQLDSDPDLRFLHS
jgi:hypothetical protein